MWSPMSSMGSASSHLMANIGVNGLSYIARRTFLTSMAGTRKQLAEVLEREPVLRANHFLAPSLPAQELTNYDIVKLLLAHGVSPEQVTLIVAPDNVPDRDSLDALERFLDRNRKLGGVLVTKGSKGPALTVSPTDSLYFPTCEIVRSKGLPLGVVLNTHLPWELFEADLTRKMTARPTRIYSQPIFSPLALDRRVREAMEHLLNDPNIQTSIGTVYATQRVLEHQEIDPQSGIRVNQRGQDLYRFPKWDKSEPLDVFNAKMIRLTQDWVEEHAHKRTDKTKSFYFRVGYGQENVWKLVLSQFIGKQWDVNSSAMRPAELILGPRGGRTGPPPL